ncbi:capsule assembly Wzi family protein [Algoriphagus sp. NBT04N3]|uniref:capsule assembly Wzi family protein n=1 Tax=Algoriphagus sp. NBT04N3 TaxID=2705473 RepID=UPI001C6362CB|nr:capsule assembly Wzi family protein [Algoriphagus sp. NBT04N3]QYH37950.1 capsule assembly Wzi family protein [Algoriphagus sp. NBT04N3]
MCSIEMKFIKNTYLNLNLLFKGLGLFFFFYFFWIEGYSQTIVASNPVIEEYFRRSQLLEENAHNFSMNLRPVDLGRKQFLEVWKGGNTSFSNTESRKSQNYFSLLPLRQSISFNSKRTYGWGNGPLLPNVGISSYTSTGLSAKWFIFRLQLAPEFVYLQNRAFQGYSGDFSDAVNRARFFYWSFGDYPERFGDQAISFLWWGQSKFTIQLGFLETGISTENIFWGPGQFSSLTFSNNARSFPHLTLRSRRPAKTFLGEFEGELLIGRLEDSGYFPSQLPNLNQRYFNRFTGDYKYLNALLISYQPKWLKGISVGFARTHQQYSRQMGNSFMDYMPVIEPFQKTVYGFDRDSEGRDQQVTFFGRFKSFKASAEMYFEYGRRDHAFNWREAILNPEHARAFLLGFQKLFPIPGTEEFISIRSEILHQQESINRTIRYAGFGGGYTWHTHGQARGFSNYGEALGTGPGVGSNVQSFEIAKVKGLSKKGILLERLVNHQDFYSRAFRTTPEVRPWIDYSVALLWDQQWNNLTFSGKAQLINAYNYQWKSGENSRRDFPENSNQLGAFLQFHFQYQF